MFSPRTRPLPDASALLGLRISLNAPVVATPELPSGPARAAIVVHEEDGQPGFAVAVRSLRAATTVVYQLEGEDLSDAAAWEVALDAALSFGESMGFLFDDEVLVPGDREARARGLEALREILGVPPGTEGEVAEGGAAPDPEILLEELEPASKNDESPAGDAWAPPALGLSKFRMVRASASTRSEGHGGAWPLAAAAKPPGPVAPEPRRGGLRLLLGRVRPIRLRRGRPAPPEPSVWMRLLSWF